MSSVLTAQDLAMNPEDGFSLQEISSDTKLEDPEEMAGKGACGENQF